VAKSLSIVVEQEQLDVLRERALQLGVSVEDLARAAVLDLVGRPGDAFEKAVQRVLAKNTELYERLA